MDALMFEVRVRDLMSKALKYASEVSQISTSINIASQQAQAEQLALRIQSSCKERHTTPQAVRCRVHQQAAFPHQWSLKEYCPTMTVRD